MPVAQPISGEQSSFRKTKAKHSRPGHSRGGFVFFGSLWRWGVAGAAIAERIGQERVPRNHSAAKNQGPGRLGSGCSQRPFMKRSGELLSNNAGTGRINITDHRTGHYFWDVQPYRRKKLTKNEENELKGLEAPPDLDVHFIGQERTARSVGFSFRGEERYEDFRFGPHGHRWYRCLG